MYYCKTAYPNFGDELNVWLWPKLLPEFFDEDERVLFLGIGSILFDFFPADRLKLVFGAGYGGYTPLPVIDDNWKIYFVRGHRTAQALDLDASLAIGDAAILIRSCLRSIAAPRYRFSFMPHWESAIDGNWHETCNIAGIHYVDPCGPVDQVLNEIMNSETLITEAMHGAIVADALRVPWIAVTPTKGMHRAKWLDWASALALEINPATLAPSNALESAMARFRGQSKWIGRLRKRAQALRHVTPGYFAEGAAEALGQASRTEPTLSHEHAIDRAHTVMLEKLDQLRRDYGQR